MWCLKSHYNIPAKELLSFRWNAFADRQFTVSQRWSTPFFVWALTVGNDLIASGGLPALGFYDDDSFIILSGNAT